jgi:hypothetical protein
MQTTESDIKKYLEYEVKNALQDEIDAYIENTKTLKSGKEEIDYIITYNEIAMLSLMKSSIVRHQESKEVWAMQEYHVYNDNKEYKGRGDLYVMLRKKHLKCDLVFEAKRLGEFKGKEVNDKEWKKEVKRATEQGKKYIIHERKHLFEPNYLIVTFFETVKSDDLDIYKKLPNLSFKLKEEYEGYEGYEEYAFYIKTTENGKNLCVHGLILNVDVKTTSK